jgi:hypothetical protein
MKERDHLEDLGVDRKIILKCLINRVGRDSDSLWAVESKDRIPVWERFRTRPDRHWGPLSPLYNAYWVSFPEVKRPGRGVDHPLHLAPRLKKDYSYISTPPLGHSWPVLG